MKRKEVIHFLRGVLEWSLAIILAPFFVIYLIVVGSREVVETGMDEMSRRKGKRKG